MSALVMGDLNNNFLSGRQTHAARCASRDADALCVNSREATLTHESNTPEMGRLLDASDAVAENAGIEVLIGHSRHDPLADTVADATVMRLRHVCGCMARAARWAGHSNQKDKSGRF